MKKMLVTLIIFFFGGFLHAAERVPGTKVSLDPPPGFVATTQYPGYMMESTGSSILVSEIPGPFAEVSKGFTKAGLATKGMSLMDKQEVKLSSGNAVLLKVSQSARGVEFLKWMLCFGDKKESVLVLATFPKQFENDVSEDLKKAILSSVWDAGAKIDRFEGLTFKVAESGDLKFAGQMGNNLSLTRNGVPLLKAKGDPLVFVGASISQDWTVPGNKKEFAKHRLTQTEILLNPEITSEKTIEIDGLNGYFVEAEGKHKDTGSKLFVMQCLLFTKDGYYMFQGVVNLTEKETYQPVFTAILNSFKRI